MAFVGWAPTKVQLRVWVDTDDGGRRRATKVVKVGDRKRGGAGRADAALREFVAALAEGRAVAAAALTRGPSHTVAEGPSAYVAHVERTGKARSTVESFGMIAKRVPAAIGALPLPDLTGADLNAFYEDLRDSYADSTIRQTHAFLNAAFGHAVSEGWIDANPTARAKAPKKVIQDRAALDPTDVRRMIESALSDPRDVVLAMAVALAAIMGKRRGELAGMKWIDLDTETGVLSIERQWVSPYPG